jgi:glycine/D-amino acid oxidase-like deaminating enzyme
MRVAVVGAGIVGSSVGWHLARAGAQVRIFDAGDPGMGVTNWTFSWFNASNKTETREYFELNLAGMAAYRDLVAEFGPGDWWHPTGHLRWNAELANSGTLPAAVDHLRSWGYGATLWRADRVNRLLEPDVHFQSADAEVAFYRDEGWIQGRGVVAQLLNDATTNGAEVFSGSEVTDIVVKGDRVVGIALADGQHHQVDAVVNASGPAGPKVATLVGRSLPMRDEPGLVARVLCDRVPIRRAMHAPRVELRPDGENRVVLHSREIDAQIGSIVDTNELSERLRRLAVDVVPSLRTSVIVEAKVAWRPIPIDGLPAVGGVDNVGGYYEAITHSGITLGVIVGRLLAREIVDGGVDELGVPYRPGRLALSKSAPS